MPKTRKREAKAKAREIIARQPKGINTEAARLYDVLNEDEVRQFVWIHMVLDPWGAITRMPLILGNGIWDEDLFRYHMYGTITANTNGLGYGLLGQDNWQSASSSDVFMGYSVVGTPLWYTDATYAPSLSPADADTVAITGLNSTKLATSTDYGGASPTLYTHILQSASAIRLRPISSADNTSGTVMVAFTKDTKNCPLTGVSYETVLGYSPNIVIRKEIPLAGWTPEKWLELPAIPHERDAFDSVPCEANGKLVVSPAMALGIFCRGMQASQSIEVEAVAIYQIEENETARVNDTFSAGASPEIPDNKYANQHGRAVMSPTQAQMLTHHAREALVPRYTHSRNLGSVHLRNPRSQVAAQAMLRSKPGLGSRIKGFFGKAANKVKDYVKDNWLSLLIKGAEAGAMLL